jgi:hydroxymethylpyrimidine pyrophosphatase-like HAD family hydrolase
VQSLAQLPPEAVRSLLGVCFDVDDTVTTHGTLDPEAYAALFALRESGLKLMAVTGRPLGFAEIIARTWPVDAAVGENGAGFLARVGKELRIGYWDPVDVRVDQQAQLGRIRQRVARELPHVHVSSDGWARRCDLAFDVGEYASHPRATIDALLSIMADEGAHTSVSSIHAHAQLGDHDKARGIALAARELWGIPEVDHAFLFVGDSGNDAAAFSHFTLTVGVANVRNHLDRLPKPPGYVTAASFGAGFAELARELVRLRS